MTKREQFIAWLGDAHAMEVGIITKLEKHIADAERLPKVRKALQRHLGETKKHAKAMEKALAAMGGHHPVVREGISKVINAVTGLGTSLAADTPVKNAIADFATEHFEIACYTSLARTAEALGEAKIAAVCRAILAEEQAMAATLAGELAAVTDFHLRGLDADEAPGTNAPAPKFPRAAARVSPKKGGKKLPAARKSVAGKAPARKKPRK